MLKFNKIMLASLVSAFGFTLFSSAGNSANAKDNSGYTSISLATKFSGNKSGTDSARFTSLHTKVVPTNIRTTLKKSNGSYYKATKNLIKFDDEKNGYHGTFSRIKDIKYAQLKNGAIMYQISDKGIGYNYYVSSSKNNLTFIYPAGKKEYSLSFNK